MTTGSSPPWARRSLSHYPQADCLFSTRVRPPHCGSVRWARSAARSSLSQSVVSSRLPPCVPLRRSPARLLRLVGQEGVRRPEARRTIKSGRSSRSNHWTRACHEGRRHTEKSLRNANAHRFDPALEKEGRAVLRGRPLRGRHSKNTDLFGRPSDRPSQFHAPPSGARRFRGWRQRFGARVCPRWALTAGGCYRLAPLRCLSARYTRPRKNARDPLRPSPPTAPPLAVRSDPSQAICNCLAGHA
jgi:hypothetical protein